MEGSGSLKYLFLSHGITGGMGTHLQERHMPEAGTQGGQRGGSYPSPPPSPKGFPEVQTPEIRSPGARQRTQTPGNRRTDPRAMRGKTAETMAKVEQEAPARPHLDPQMKRHPAHLCLYWPPLDAASAGHQHLMSGRFDRRLGLGISRGLCTVLDIAGLPLGLG